MASVPQNSTSERVIAVDILRGAAVIVWICATLGLPILLSLPRSVATEFAVKQLSHSVWHGLTLADFMLPAFLVAMGAAIAIRSAQHEADLKYSVRILRIARRTAVLFLLGLVCTGEFRNGFRDLRWVGPFQQIAVCYLLVASLYRLLNTPALLVGALLLFINYWGALLLGGIEGHSTGPYSMEGNFAIVVDQLFLPGRAYFGTWDPQGILTTMPAIATTFLGAALGRIFVVQQFSAPNKSLILAAVGSFASLNGLMLSSDIPVNGYLWTLPFVLIVAGLLAIFASLVNWLSSFRIPGGFLLLLQIAGENSLILILSAALLQRCSVFSRSVFPGSQDLAGNIHPAVFMLSELLLLAGIAYFFHRKRVHLNV